MVREIFVALVSVVGTALFAAILYLFLERRDWRKKATLDLYWEFHGNDLYWSRMQCDNLLRSQDERDDPETPVELYFRLEDDFYPIGRVFHFFEKLSLLARHKLIDRPLTAAMFGHIFHLYYERYFSKLRYSSRLDLKGREKWLADIFWLADLLRVSKGA